MLNDKCVFLYTTFTGLIALCIFLYGYVPVFSSPLNTASNEDLPITIDGFSVDPKAIYNRHVQKLVLIFVDSLSMDILTDKTGFRNLPHTLRLIDKGDACLVPCNAPPPSTTMKKIKTLATGTSSSVIDTILTFGVKELEMDSIFRQANNNKLILSLHGAEIWKQLFPGYFRRAETIDLSKRFNYTEVDANVTETLLFTEMDKDDWDWLLLHYVGLKDSELDRLSNSHQFQVKLRELDSIIEFAHTRLRAQTKDHMILIVGDAGTQNPHMNVESDKIPEMIAPYVAIGKTCRYSDRPTKLMDHYDLAPTLAVLTGLPIPASSYGNLIPAVLLNFMTDDESLYALHYNTAKLMNLTSQLNIKYAEDPVDQLFQNAVIQHGRYLQRFAKGYNQFQLHHTTSTMYTRTAEELSKRINDLLNTSDVSVQYLALVLIFEAMIMLLNRSDIETANKRLSFLVTSVTNLLILAWVLATGMSKRGTSFIHMTYGKGFVIANVAVIMLCNSYIMASQKSFLRLLLSSSAEMIQNSKENIRTVSSKVEAATSKNKKLCSLVVFLVSGTVFQAFSLLELRYMKSEKTVWFFLWTSTCLLILHKRFGKLYESATPTNDHELLSRSENPHQGVILVVFSILTMHRAIMAYTEIDHWLSHENNYICSSICLIFGLVLLAITCGLYYEPVAYTMDKIITRILLGLICCFIYMTNAAQGKVILPYYPKSDGGLEMLMFWVTWTIILAYALGFCAMKTCYNGQSSSKRLIATGVTCWTCFTALFTHSHKVLLIPVEILFAHGISEVFKKQNPSLMISHVWLGRLFSHYQGNTQNLDSVEAATSLLVSKNFSSLIHGVLLIMNTFSASILSYLICVYNILDNNSVTRRASDGISRTNFTFGCCHLLLMTVYLLGMLVHRYNRWCWSILCPKFLYQIVYTFFITAAMITAQITGIFHDLCLK